MTKHKILTALFCLAMLGGMCSCAKVVVNKSPIRSAVKITAEDVTASAATIKFTTATAPEASEVASFLVVGPVTADKLPYSEWNPIQCLDVIESTGMIENAPYKKTFTGLEQGTDYAFGVVAVNAKGEICTAPTFFTFSTETIITECLINCESEEAPFVYNYTVTPKFADKIQYIVSSDPKIVKMNDMDLLLEVMERGVEATGTVTNHFELTEKKDAVVAAVAYDENNEMVLTSFSSCTFSSKATVSVVVGGTKTNLQQPKEDVLYFTGEVQMPASGEFTINISNAPYGFTPYSGNGGIGTIANEFAAVPFYNMKPEHTYKFNVEKSVGQMTPVADGGIPFWLNRAEAGKVQVTVDQTYGDGIPRYFIKAVSTDSKRVFYEGFDLFVFGSFYQAPVAGTKCSKATHSNGQAQISDIPNIDGTEPGVKNGVTATTTNGIVPFTFGGPVVDPEKDGQPTETFIKNRDLLGWQLKRTSEFPGHIQLGNSQSVHFDAYFVTPKLSALTGATNIVIETAAFRFAGEGDIILAVLNAGTISKVVVEQASTECSTGEAVTTGEYAPSTANEFTLTKAILPKCTSNAATNKPIAKISLYVTGATADTQVKFYVPEEVTGKEGRCSFDYVNIYKQ